MVPALLLMLSAASVQAAPAFVQGNCEFMQNTDTSVVPLPDAQLAGSTIVVVAHVSGSGVSVASVSDTNGNSYVDGLDFYFNDLLEGRVYYAVNALPGPNSVTVRTNQPTPGGAIFVHEYSGPFTAPPQFSWASGSTSDMTVSPHSLNADTLFFADGMALSAVTSVDAPFTSRETCWAELSTDTLATTAGDYAPLFHTTSTGGWVVLMAELAAGTQAPDAGQSGSGPGPSLPADAGAGTGVSGVGSGVQNPSDPLQVGWGCSSAPLAAWPVSALALGMLWVHRSAHRRRQ